MNVIVLGKHARLPSFIKLKPSGLWELENANAKDKRKKLVENVHDLS